MVPIDLLNKYKIENPRLASYIDCLNRFGVVGFEKQYDMNMVSLWLDKNKIIYEKNNGFLIWIDELKESIKKQLRKNL